jgi:hypothetical protein
MTVRLRSCGVEITEGWLTDVLADYNSIMKHVEKGLRRDQSARELHRILA